MVRNGGRGVAQGDGGQHGQADSATDLLSRDWIPAARLASCSETPHTEAMPKVAKLMPDPSAITSMPGQDLGHVGAVHGDARDEEHPDGEQGAPATNIRFTPTFGTSALARPIPKLITTPKGR